MNVLDYKELISVSGGQSFGNLVGCTIRSSYYYCLGYSYGGHKVGSLLYNASACK